jgi:hypothetical protein
VIHDFLVFTGNNFWHNFRHDLEECWSYGGKTSQFMELELDTIVTGEAASVVYCSDFLATDPETRVRFPALSEKKVLGLERGPLLPVSKLRSYLREK